jgi:hypothetical protein
MSLDPYSGTARLVLYALVALAIVGAVARWKYAEGALRKSRGEVARLEADATARAKNADLAAAIARRAADRDAKRVATDRKIEEEIRRVAKPLPEACRAQCLAWYAPVQRVRDIVRADQQGRGAPAP